MFLGLVKSGIYKHYESKEAIWNALPDRKIAYYGESFGSAEHPSPVPDFPEDFVSMTMRMVNLTIRGEQIVKTRKVLPWSSTGTSARGTWRRSTS